ncbi:hypothetical protein ACIBBD_32495 [Streptomyces sp. NPDC051315]|uniref:hypothetical protein n=1 Tax=Streptomyces sp. NPDC051315 TaxID=3365650 RepID=UPI0037AFA4AF
MNGILNGIEFFHYPSADHPSYPLWGIRIDGTDLRTSVADATRGLWRAELEGEFEDDEREIEEHVRDQHGGLGVRDFEDRPGHFLTPADATPLLGCPCGIWGCWPLLARVTVTPTTVTWSSFRQPYREEWGELAMGPYAFPRDRYETALAEPVALDEDPLP